MNKKVIIIGSGLAGLSSGIYLQQKGIQTEIFELAPWAGGQCTAWIRKGYRFDGCIHWMVGTRRGTSIYKEYIEVGALGEDTVIYNSPSIRTELNGEIAELPLDEKKFREYLLSLSKEDTKAINTFCNDIETMAKCDMAAGMPDTLTGMMRFVFRNAGFIKLTAKYFSKTWGEIVNRLKGEKLKRLMQSFMQEDISAMGTIMMLGTRIGGNAGYPMGGASDVIKRMEEKYRALGGSIRFQSKVDEIVVSGGMVTGIICKGELYPARGVIAACDAYDTLRNMLKGQFCHPQLDRLLKEEKLFSPLMLISFGLDKKFDIPFATNFECKEGIAVASGEYTYRYNLRSFEFDSSSAPSDCSSVMVMFEAPLGYWMNLRKDNKTEYDKQKASVAEVIKAEIDKRYPGFAAAVRVTDVSTPATYVRLTNVYKGSYEGFLPTPGNLMTNIQKGIPGVDNLFLCGQWTMAGGGICTAIHDGKAVANKMERALKRH